MKIIKKIICLALLLGLSGCMKVRWYYQIDRQGNVDGSVDVLVLATLLDGYQEEVDLPEGSTIITEGDYQGYNIPLDQQQKDQLATYITIEDNVLTFKMPNNENKQFLTNIISGIANMPNMSDEEIIDQGFEISVDFTVPGKIKENNATAIVDGKLHYDLLAFNDDELYFTCELGMDPMIIYVLAGIGIVGCCCLIVWVSYYYRKKKNNRNA